MINNFKDRKNCRELENPLIKIIKRV